MIGNLQFSVVCDNLYPAGVGYFSLHQFWQLVSLVTYSYIVVLKTSCPLLWSLGGQSLMLVECSLLQMGCSLLWSF